MSNSENTKEKDAVASAVDAIVNTPFEFCKVNLPRGTSIPEGYRLIEAYEKDGEIVVPIYDIPEGKEHLHDCDIEGCGTFSHVVRFTVEEKYKGC